MLGYTSTRGNLSELHRRIHIANVSDVVKKRHRGMKIREKLVIHCMEKVKEIKV